MKNKKSLLAKAYALSIRTSRSDAVALLRGAFADSAEMREQMTEECQLLSNVIKRRGAGACHITAVTHNLLQSALTQGQEEK